MAICNMTIGSEMLNMDTEVAVILPEKSHKLAELQPDKKYPVIYCLHGYRDNFHSWLVRSTLSEEASKHECVIVMPDCKNSFYINGKCGFDYYDYVTKELPIKMANYFPISTSREDTFIMGASMGGFGSFLYAMSNPEQYAAAFSFSGALCIEYVDGVPFPFDKRMSKQVLTEIGTEEEYQNADYNLHNLALKLDKYDGNKPRFMAVCGNEDPCVKYNNDIYQFVKENTSLDYTYITSSGEHKFSFWNQYIDSAFKFFGIK